MRGAPLSSSAQAAQEVHPPKAGVPPGDTLRIGIKRKTHRRDDVRAAQADAEFTAVRQRALERSGYLCVDCGYKSLPTSNKGAGAGAGTGKVGSSLQVHHVNDDHADNREENLAAKSALCHAYHHVGCDAAGPDGCGGWSSRMRVAYAPELSAADLNLLQLAVGVAMDAGGAQKAAAQAIYTHLMHLTQPVSEAWGTSEAKNFAAALERLTATQYEHRRVGDLRLVFHPDLLKSQAENWHKDYSMLTPPAWPSLTK